MTGPTATPDEPAVDVDAGEQYEGGTRVNFPTLGFSLVIPDGWFGGANPERTGFLIASATEPGAIQVMPVAAEVVDDLLAVLREPWPVASNFLLEPAGQAVEGNRARGSFGGPEGSAAVAGAAIGLLGSGGHGLILAAIGAQQHADSLRAVLDGLAETAMTAQPSADALAAEWGGRLLGRRLAYQEGSVSGWVSAGPLGASMPQEDPVENLTYHLLPGGRMTWAASETAAGGSGEWRVYSLGGQVVLELRRPHSHPEYRALDLMDGVVIMDGRRAVLSEEAPGPS